MKERFRFVEKERRRSRSDIFTAELQDPVPFGKIITTFRIGRQFDTDQTARKMRRIEQSPVGKLVSTDENQGPIDGTQALDRLDDVRANVSIIRVCQVVCLIEQDKGRRPGCERHLKRHSHRAFVSTPRGPVVIELIELADMLVHGMTNCLQKAQSQMLW
ncbi:hypothetical protein GCM10007901_23680 [Dyella acidisoli]|uniref:Uncharacterized protein n=1 Tax=Dyella acidisoli TaxID=1867834 RepID=A0ABQ5XPW2_9GAMM|nr:hypothetical protein GCM10007901_23680 [Dyella acidisoli]